MDFSILAEDVQTLLSHRDMILNEVGISIQGFNLHEGEYHRPMSSDNYFLAWRWLVAGTSYALYNEENLKRTYRGFGNQSVKKLTFLTKGEIRFTKERSQARVEKIQDPLRDVRRLRDRQGAP